MDDTDKTTPEPEGTRPGDSGKPISVTVDSIPDPTGMPPEPPPAYPAPSGTGGMGGGLAAPVPAVLPPSRDLSLAQRRDLDRSLGIPEPVILEVYANRERTYYELLLLLGVMALGGVILYFFFPWSRFFAPLPVARGPEFRPEYYTDSDVERAGGMAKLTPLQSTLHLITMAVQEGNLNRALDQCRHALRDLPPDVWKQWLPVWEHYFFLLYRNGLHAELSEETANLLEVVPGATFSRGYLAQSYLDRIVKKSEYSDAEKRQVREAYRLLTDAINQIRIQLDAGVAEILSKEEVARMNADLRLYRLQLARAHRALWWIKGRPDDGDVVDEHRDEALRILTRLGKQDLEALELRKEILREILDDWHTGEFRERYLGDYVWYSTVDEDYKVIRGWISSAELNVRGAE